MRGWVGGIGGVAFWFGSFSGLVFSALEARAYFLLLRQKKVAKEKATPGSAPASPVPCATRQAGRLRNSGLRPSNSPRRLPPAYLRCSAPLKGPGKPSGSTVDSVFQIWAFFPADRSICAG